MFYLLKIRLVFFACLSVAYASAFFSWDFSTEMFYKFLFSSMCDKCIIVCLVYLHEWYVKEKYKYENKLD